MRRAGAAARLVARVRERELCAAMEGYHQIRVTIRHSDEGSPMRY